VRRAFRNGRIKCPKTEGSVRAVPLQAVALDALEQLPAGTGTDLLFPSLRGAYFDLHNFRTREWKPAQLAAGIEPLRRIYEYADLLVMPILARSRCPAVVSGLDGSA